MLPSQEPTLRYVRQSAKEAHKFYHLLHLGQLFQPGVLYFSNKVDKLKTEKSVSYDPRETFFFV